MSLRQVWYSFLAALALAPVVLCSTWFYNHRNDPDVQTVVIHAVVDCIPFLAGIIFALWPREVSSMHNAWRIVILAGGLIWSGLLARRDYLDLQASKRELQNAVTSAVSSANQHSDQQLFGLKTEVGDVSTTLNGRLDRVVNEVSKSDSDITGAIGKVIIPPPKYAQLQFSLFPSDPNARISPPLLAETVSPNEDGSFSVDFLATNISDTAAASLEFWVEICRLCSYAKEPDKFEKVNSTIETIRHRTFGSLNAGVSTDKMTVQLKVPVATPFEIGFHYSCETCGKLASVQIVTIAQQISSAGP
jgi:hypothetical protein